MTTAHTRQRVPATIAGTITGICRDGIAQPNQAALDAVHIIGTAAGDV